MQISVRQLKAHLSKYLNLAQAGKLVIVTSHKTPQVKLIPAVVAEEIGIDGMLRSGSAAWNGKKPFGGKLRPKVSGKTAADRVLEDR